LKESRGEVLKPEISTTVRTKPERDGLSVKEYFGPVKILNVRKRIRYKGSSVTVVVLKLRKVRRDRVGHINLVVPIAHIWYFRSLPNKIGYILGLPSKKLDMIILRKICSNPSWYCKMKVNQSKIRLNRRRIFEYFRYTSC
jgi:DNA-directed RNA polymerase subunit beta'